MKKKEEKGLGVWHIHEKILGIDKKQCYPVIYIKGFTIMIRLDKNNRALIKLIHLAQRPKIAIM